MEKLNWNVKNENFVGQIKSRRWNIRDLRQGWNVRTVKQRQIWICKVNRTFEICGEALWDQNYKSQQQKTYFKPSAEETY